MRREGNVMKSDNPVSRREERRKLQIKLSKDNLIELTTKINSLPCHTVVTKNVHILYTLRKHPSKDDVLVEGNIINNTSLPLWVVRSVFRRRIRRRRELVIKFVLNNF